MKLLSLSLLVVSVISCASGTPIIDHVDPRVTSNLTPRQGTPCVCSPNDPYYTWESENKKGKAVYSNGSRGQYSIVWSEIDGTIRGGKGWNPGTWTRTVRYAGNYQPTGDSHLAVYGWTRNPLIEYFIVESYGDSPPAPHATRTGAVTCDGADYEIWQAWRLNQPTIEGIRTYQQFWSIRKAKKPLGAVTGTVDVACHLDAWRKLGLHASTSHYSQILAVEGKAGSSGSASMTVYL
ncbi:xylanase [Coprinopsis sp. MPI-PUGE-AT-0042]|nr:xylanase [Coprinopsis sp. MPI-PUGE-AT-0042]